jgi:hypothetical protein
MIVVDGDPNNDGNPEDAKIAGNVLLTGKYASDGSPMFNTDDTIIKHDGMGGQGVYPIPNVNPGWVEKLDLSWNLTSEQRDPTTSFNQLNKQPLQANNNGDSSRNDVNSESIQHQQQEQTTPQINVNNSESIQHQQQEQTTPQIIEEKIAQLQQQSVLQAIAPNMVTEQAKAPSLDKLNDITSSIPVPSP